MMADYLMYLNSLGLSPATLAVIALLWRMDKRMTYLEYKVGG